MLTAQDIHAIEDAMSRIPVEGARYPAHLQQRVGK
jgi:hypothetical protein